MSQRRCTNCSAFISAHGECRRCGANNMALMDDTALGLVVVLAIIGILVLIAVGNSESRAQTKREKPSLRLITMASETTAVQTQKPIVYDGHSAVTLYDFSGKSHRVKLGTKRSPNNRPAETLAKQYHVSDGECNTRKLTIVCYSVGRNTMLLTITPRADISKPHADKTLSA